MIGRFELVLAGILVLLVPLLALIDILKSQFKGNEKLVWVLVVIIFPLIGPILYYFIGMNQKISD